MPLGWIDFSKSDRNKVFQKRLEGYDAHVMEGLEGA